MLGAFISISQDLRGLVWFFTPYQLSRIRATRLFSPSRGVGVFLNLP